jgi:DNA-binding MarR family transcriptional regulator
MTHDIDVLAQNIIYVIPQIMRMLAAELRRSGHLMTPGNFQLMFSLLEGPANLSELAECQNVSLPTMSRSVRRLEEIGWISRGSDPHDRRMTIIALTEDGKRRLHEMSEHAQATLRKLMQTMSDEERETLFAGLEVMRKTFDLNELEKV